MEKELLEQIAKAVSEQVSGSVEKTLDEFKGAVLDEAKQAAAQTAEDRAMEFARKQALNRKLFGFDNTGMSEEQKSALVLAALEIHGIKSNAYNDLVEKAGKELTEATGPRGGYLVPTETADAIAYVANATGLVTRLGARYWPMESNKLEIPAYTGSILQWQFYSTDASNDRNELTVQGIAFEQVVLEAKPGGLPFALTKTLLQHANVNLADFLVYLAGESYANTVDSQALVGSGAPFTGVLNHTGVASAVLSTGNTTYASVANEIEKLHELIVSVPSSIRAGSAFVMHDSVWQALVSKKDANGNFIINLEAQQGAIMQYAQQNGISPAGFIFGYPVFTHGSMPATSDATQNNKPFVIFGNFVGIAHGLRSNELSLTVLDSGVWDGKELSLTGRKGFLFEGEMAVAVALPKAFAVLKTAAA